MNIQVFDPCVRTCSMSICYLSIRGFCHHMNVLVLVMDSRLRLDLVLVLELDLGLG